jgi:NAD(P)-dependent dehydrogenase (short-subunit alcohol dehydrogenase family)
MTDFGAGAAFVLGGSGALGGAICAAFAKAGVPVGLSYYKGAKAGEATVANLRALGVEAIAVQANAGDRASVVAALQETAKAFGTIHSVVYAGARTLRRNSSAKPRKASGWTGCTMT